MLIVRIAFPIVCFALLYTVAFISNRHYRDSDDVLFISKSQFPEGHGNIIDVNSIKEISLSNITYHMVWQPRNDTELKCRIEAPILVKSDVISEIIVRTEGEKWEQYETN